MKAVEKEECHKMKKSRKKSFVPLYAAAIPWVVWAMLFPMYKLWHFICLVILSVAAYKLAENIALRKNIGIEKETPSLEVNSKDKNIRELAEQGNNAIKEFTRLNDQIKNSKISGCIDSIVVYMQKIFDNVAQNPEKLPKIRRFLNYYLPTTQKILTAYANLENQNADTKNISETMVRIEGMADKIEEAFKHQLDSLFGDDALDIKSDIAVLENMMAREGIINDDINQSQN